MYIALLRISARGMHFASFVLHLHNFQHISTSFLNRFWLISSLLGDHSMVVSQLDFRDRSSFISVSCRADVSAQVVWSTMPHAGCIVSIILGL